MSEVVEVTASARKIAGKVTSLPPLPATAQDILLCFGDEFIDADKVADVVEGDPGICGKLLGLANSAYFGLSEPVHSIREAIARVLGVDTVRSLVLAMAILQSFDIKICPGFDARRFWMQSLLTAECCKRIVAADSLATDAARDMAYTTGLCHNLGLMALAHMEPKSTHSVLRTFHEDPEADDLRSLFVAELETDHRIMTAELARAWSLPQPMVVAYQYRAFPDSPCEERLGLVVASAAAAVNNMETEIEKRIDLSQWANDFGFAVDDLQQMAKFGERQLERVQSLVGNMSA